MHDDLFGLCACEGESDSLNGNAARELSNRHVAVTCYVTVGRGGNIACDDTDGGQVIPRVMDLCWLAKIIAFQKKKIMFVHINKAI